MGEIVLYRIGLKKVGEGEIVLYSIGLKKVGWLMCKIKMWLKGAEFIK
jgi:hypothetical protein